MYLATDILYSRILSMIKQLLIACCILSAAVVVGAFQQWAMGFFIDAKTQAVVCSAKIESGYITMNKVCLEQDIYPKLSHEDVLNLVRSDIDIIDEVYDIDKEYIEFSGSTLLSSSIKSLDYYKALYLKKSGLSDIIDGITSPEISIPLKTLAMEQLKWFGIVAADRDISKYGDCATQNFMVGMKAMEHVVVNPGQIRNANKTFAYLPGYCTGSSSETYMFYQWICGVSSMAFRASALNPSIKILKRSGHTKRFTKYYGDVIAGDDAAIYENIKQFEIKNVSDYPLYIKSKIIWKRPYLVFISQKPLLSLVVLRKQQTGPLSARIDREFIHNGEVLKESWSSEYVAKTEEGN